MLLPPSTGNPELDLFNYNIAKFLDDLPASVSYNQSTGLISDPKTKKIFGYIHQYLLVRYVDNISSGNNFSTNPDGRAYVGLLNSPNPTPLNSESYTKYAWLPIDNPQTPQYFWYKLLGGRNLDYRVSSTTPGVGWTLLESPANLIDLDVLIKVPEINPVFLYDTDGNVSQINYESGNYKVFTYDTEGILLQMDYVTDALTKRRTFNYDIDGVLTSITDTEII
jgi:hypothetical protein